MPATQWQPPSFDFKRANAWCPVYRLKVRLGDSLFIPQKKSIAVFSIGLASILFQASTFGMSLIVQGDTLFATGLIDDDYGKFRQILAQPQIKRIVYVNSPGGDLWTGFAVGRLTAENKLATVVAGRCLSACALMFLGGTERNFSDAFPPEETYLGIHGPHNKLTQELSNEFSDGIYAYMKMRIGARFNANIMNKALFDMADAGALLYIFDGVRNTQLNTMHCRSRTVLPKDCTQLTNANAINLGLVTSGELIHLELPAFPEKVTVIPTVPQMDAENQWNSHGGQNRGHSGRR